MSTEKPTATSLERWMAEIEATLREATDIAGQMRTKDANPVAWDTLGRRIKLAATIYRDICRHRHHPPDTSS